MKKELVTIERAVLNDLKGDKLQGKTRLIQLERNYLTQLREQRDNFDDKIDNIIDVIMDETLAETLNDGQMLDVVLIKLKKLRTYAE